MRSGSKYLLAVLMAGLFSLQLAAQCPPRPSSGTVVKNPYTLTSSNGVLSASMELGYSVDNLGYTHYCYKYAGPTRLEEAPTLEVSPGDELQLSVTDGVPAGQAFTMDMGPVGTNICGQQGTPTLSSTNVHFHGLNVPPVCHQDDVINTLIQPGGGPFTFKMKIPTDEPPGLYWYHPHVHGFTEFQVNGGAAGAIVVKGMEKARPEVSGLVERVFVIRQQYLVPWIPGPYQLTFNFQTAMFPGPYPMIQMATGQRQFWRVVNATIQDFMPLQYTVNGKPQPMQLIAVDGYPLSAPEKTTTITIPPAGRAEFIVDAPPEGSTAELLTQTYDTGPTGNPDIEEVLGKVVLTTQSEVLKTADVMPTAPKAPSDMPLKFANLASKPVTTQRKLFFSEEFGGTNGPIQFYITVDGQKQKVFQMNEKPVITTKVGAIEDWTIENRALETHAFHMHQIHFLVMEVDGQPVPAPYMADTVPIPYWSGSGAYHSVKVRMDFSDPTIAGTFVFHCHVLLHEDLGMMHKILVEP